jgi:hypothetical protein
MRECAGRENPTLAERHFELSKNTQGLISLYRPIIISKSNAKTL